VFISAGVIFLSCVFVRFASAAADTPEYRVSAATTLLVGCLMATVKLSAATFCSVIVVAVLVRLALDARKSLREPFSGRLVVSVAAVSGLLLAGFLVRGFVLSGYPLYPSTLLGLDVDWQVPVVQAQADRVFIKTWSQLRPTYDMAAAANQDWVKGWLNSLILTEKLTTVLPLVLITVLSSGTMRKEGADPVAGTGQWALVVLWAASILALAVWLDLFLDTSGRHRRRSRRAWHAGVWCRPPHDRRNRVCRPGRVRCQHASPVFASAGAPSSWRVCRRDIRSPVGDRPPDGQSSSEGASSALRRTWDIADR
jgi:hypothetical protein